MIPPDNKSQAFSQMFEALQTTTDNLRVIRHPNKVSPEVRVIDAADWDEGRFNDRSASEGPIIRIKDTGNYHSMCLALLHEYGHVLLGHTTHRPLWQPIAETRAEAVAWLVGRRRGITVDRSPHYAAIWQRETVEGVYADDNRVVTDVVDTKREAERVAAASRQLLAIADSQ